MGIFLAQNGIQGIGRNPKLDIGKITLRDRSKRRKMDGKKKDNISNI